MSIDLRDLSHDDVVRLTKMLCRRPEYGIAIPSAKWLRRQEEKAKHLPKHMLRPTNPIKRLVMKLADSMDPHMTDPQAVLCPTHAQLNPWLLRRAFMAIAYEVTVHSDALRSWDGLALNDAPAGLGALVARLDAVNALWTPPELYRGFYGAAPFANHLVHVRSGCEACILAAVGANARVLADLSAVVRDRRERRSDGGSRKGRTSTRTRTPRIERVLEAWIDHLGPERAALCRAWSDDALARLRAVRADVARWRSEQKRAHQRDRGRGRKSVYTELRGGNRLSAVPSDARRTRRTRDGIPVALRAAVGGREEAAPYYGATGDGDGDAQSVFRPDSECGHTTATQVGVGGRPAGPELGRSSGGSLTRSFIQRFEREMAMDDDEKNGNEYEYEYGEEEEYDDEYYYEGGEGEGREQEERDLEQEERSRTKVRDWYATRLGNDNDKGNGNGNRGADDDAKSVALSAMMHPAFQPYAVAPSAVPQPLDLDLGAGGSGGGRLLRKDRDPQGAHAHAHADAWTEATAYTIDPSASAAAALDAPPVPRVPEQHHQELNWPAPPQDRDRGKANAKRYLFPDSEAGSKISATQRRYLRDRRGMRDVAPALNPFVDTSRGERASAARSSGSSSSSSSRRRRSRRTSAANTPSLSRSHGDTVEDQDDDEDEDEEEEEEDEEVVGSVWGAGSETDDDDDDDALRPDDSISNVYFKQPPPPARSEVTSFGEFMRKAGGQGGRG
ncbi:hypothetical protein F4809DRAFT_656242 [Biscogniauxia mediterranea]|nr:hypothetical protein F4809DRAFT_656242 [Biscogniauxia mediterranea]